MGNRTELPDGCYHVRYTCGREEYCKASLLHRLDGPAVIYKTGDIGYFVNGKIPKTILDIVIIDEEMDFEMFPSATPISNYYNSTGLEAYRVNDPDELVLAILRYS